ncbi:MAG: hypothetical protein HC844_21190 [Tabrizicola sp.]|nr:hypothetical protein [Tabrizicola sp.]
MPSALRLAFVLSCIASQGCTQTTPACSFTGPTVFPEMETAKAAFLTGDYQGFFGLAAAQMPNTDGVALMAGITEAVPDGFASCTTVVQREDVGGLVQEITLFQLPEGKGPISVYVQSALIDGQRVILQFSFDTTFANVLEKLR